MAITAEELNIILRVQDAQFQKQLKAATKSVNGFSANTNRRLQSTTKAFNTMGRSAGANRAALQNASFQIQDIITQITMGTSATRALSIQLPQLLGGFGALGAAVGVGVGALGMFAPALLDSADSAEDAEKSVEALADSVNALKAAQANFSASNSDLLDSYGSLADRARDLLAIQREMAAFRATSALDSTLRTLAGSADLQGAFGINPEDIREASDSLDKLRESIHLLQTTGGQRSDAGMIGALKELERLQEHESNLAGLVGEFDNLAEMLGITKEEAGEVAAKFAEVAQAQGPREQADAMLQLVNYIRDASGNLEKTTEEGRALHDQLVLAVQAAFDLASVDLSSNITVAANEADRLRANLQAARGARIDALTNNPDFSDPRGDAGSADAGRIIRDRGVPTKNRPGYKAPKGSKSRGGGSGGSKQQTAMQRLIEEVALNEQLLGLSDERQQVMRRLGSDAANYSQTEIDGIVQRISAYETEKAALEEIERLQQGIADTVESSMTDAFTSIIDGTKSAEDAFKDMARSIIAELMRVLVVQQLVGSFKTGGGGILGALAPIFGKASGGPVKAGQPYMVGEHGAEPFVPSQGGRILSVGQAKSAIAGGGDGPSINQTINISTGVAQTVRAEMRSMMPRIIDAAKAAVSDEARRNPTYRGTL